MNKATMNKLAFNVASTVVSAAIIGGATSLWTLNRQVAEIKTDVATIRNHLGLRSYSFPSLAWNGETNQHNIKQ